MDKKRKYKGGNINELAKPKSIKKDNKNSSKRNTNDFGNTNNRISAKNTKKNNTQSNNFFNNNKNFTKFSDTQPVQTKKQQTKQIKKQNNNIKYKNIDEAVIIIQRFYRKYINIKKEKEKKHSELIKLIQDRKKNILQNFNNADKNIIKNNFISTLNNNTNDMGYNVFEAPFNLYKDLNNETKKIKNEDIIINDQEEKNEIKDIKDINDDGLDNSKSNIYKNTQQNDENENSDGMGVFAKIFKNMQKEANNNFNNINENELNDLNDDIIDKKDNLIDNQLELIKNFQQNQIINNSIITTKKEDEKKNTNTDFNNIKKENNNSNIEIENIHEISNNTENIETNNNNKNLNISKTSNNTEINSENKNEKTTEKKSQKNEVFERLANFLDSTVKQPDPLLNPQNSNNIPQQININNIPISNNINIENDNNNIIFNQNNNNNLNSYMNNVQQQADNIALNLELKEAKKTIETMSSVISELKQQLKSKDDYLNKALLNQKNENDQLINRQNTLMESLMSEKRQMEIQINDLQCKLNESEKLNYKKLQSMRENYEIETKKNKDAWFQAEKLRRKKWEGQKIKEIKELTAKGLEPEIEKIISNHKKEINDLEEKYVLDIKTQKEKLIEEYENKYQQLKVRYVKEKDDAIECEKNLAIQRLRNQSERLEDEITEERRRWNAKLNSEIQRLESLREKDKKIYEEQITKLEERNNKNIFSNENFYQKKYDDMQKEYDKKLKTEIDNIKKELESKNNEILDMKKIELDKKYKEMKNDLLKDRDKQINIVIEKLGEESLNERKKNLAECEKKANEKNLSLIEENNNLKNKITDLTNKLQAETKNRINMEQNIDVLNKKLKSKELTTEMQENKIKQLQENYDEVSNKLSGLTRDFNKEKMNLEIEMKSNLQKGDAEIVILKNKLDNAQNLFDKQRKEIEENHRKEIENIEEKIKKSFMRKDEIIRKLQEDCQTKELTIQKYEDLLNQQRKELFGK